MSTSSDRGWFGDFWGFFSAYARTGLHAATAVAVTVGFGLTTFAWWYAAAGILIYVLPPIYLYATGYTPGDSDDADTDAESPADNTGPASARDRSASDAGSDRADADTDRSTADTDRADAEPESPDTEPSAPTAGESDTGSEPSTGSGSGTGAEVAEDRPEPGGKPDTDAEQADDRSASPGAAASDETDDEPEEWIEADSPVETALYDVAVARTGPYAVGEGGVVLARRSDGWETAIEAGPTAESNTLRGVDATAEGAHVWFVGDSGVLGQYDAEAERLTDYSAPADRTSTWEDIAVVGEAGAERLFLADGSGEVVRGENDGGSITWDEGQKPGSGSSIAAADFAGEYGVLCDTNQAVFETTDGGESYTKIGVEDANATFTDLAGVDSSRVVVACDDGSVVRYDGERWTTRPVAEGALAAVDRTPDAGLAAGAGGNVYEHADGDWNAVSTPVETDLAGIVVGSDDRTDHDAPDVAVGAEGTIVER